VWYHEPHCQLIDIENQSITQYAHPLITEYRHQMKLARGQMLVAQTIAGLEIAIDLIFG